MNTTNSANYRAEYYVDYASTHQGDAASRGHFADLKQNILPLLPSDRHNRILDVGCGQGTLVNTLSANGYLKVVGVDVSQEQITIANQNGCHTCICDDLFDFALHNKVKFQTLVALDLVEHFDPSELLHLFVTLNSMLELSGELIIRTPNGSSPYSGRLRYGDLTHGTIFTRDSLSQLAELTGFTLKLVTEPTIATTGAKSIIRRIGWKLIAAAIRVPLVVETGQLHGHIVTQNLLAVLVKTSED